MQRRIAASTREMLEQFMEGKPFKEENYIVREGKLASQVCLQALLCQKWLSPIGQRCCHACTILCNELCVCAAAHLLVVFKF